LKIGTANHFADGVPVYQNALSPIRELLDLYPTFPEDRKRSSIGMRLRDKKIHHPTAGVHWSASLLFSLVHDLAQAYDVDADCLDVEKANAVIARYNSFAGLVQDLKLYDVGETRPLLDGKEVIGLVNAKPGPWLAGALEQIVQWQLDRESATKQDCIEWVTVEASSGRIRPPVQAPPAKKLRRK